MGVFDGYQARSYLSIALARIFDNAMYSGMDTMIDVATELSTNVSGCFMVSITVLNTNFDRAMMIVADRNIIADVMSSSVVVVPWRCFTTLFFDEK